MEWTYSQYTGANAGIPAFIIFIIFFVVAFILCCPGGDEFITNQIIGADLREIVDRDYSKDPINKKTKICDSLKRPVQIITIFLWLFATVLLSIVIVLIFEGCFMSSARLVPNDNCPRYPMDCFIFNGTSVKPVTNYASFHCDPLNTSQFPMNMTNPIAFCYGWIFRFQTVEAVLDQLGVCSGIVGLFTTLLVVIIYLGKSKGTIILSGFMISVCVPFFIACIKFKLSFSTLTFGVLFLGISLGLFGIFLYNSLPEELQAKGNSKIIFSNSNSSQTNRNQVSHSSTEIT